MIEKTLFKEPKNIGETAVDQITEDFMSVVNDSNPLYEEHFQELKTLNDEKDRVSKTDDPSITNKRTNPGILHKAIQKTVKQMEKPTVRLFASEASENVRATMQGLQDDCLKKAGWVRVLTSKKTGAQRNMVESGDAVISGSANPFGTFPFQFTSTQSERCFANPDAVEMRNPGSETEVRRWVKIVEYQWEQAASFFPELDGKAALGALPCWTNDDKDLRFDELQKGLVARRRIQLAFCYDIDYTAEDGTRGLSCIIAGANKFKFNQLEGKDYEWRDKDDNPVIPDEKLICFPRTNTFWNFGFLQTLYKLGEMHSKLTNQGITYTLSNTNPVRVIATTMSQQEVAGQIARAMKDGSEGKIPFMVAADGSEFGGVSNTSAPPVINEANAVLELIEKDIAQLGISLNDIMTDKTKTLGALQLEVAAATDLVKYIQDTNAPAYEFLVELMNTYLKNRKVDDSNVRLVSSVKIRTEDGKEEEVMGVPEKDEMGNVVRDKKGKTKIFRSFTLQDYKEMLNLYDWKEVSQGGVINNSVLEDALDRNTQEMFPGTKAAKKAAASMAQRHGRNYEEGDFDSQITGAQMSSGDKF